MLDYKRSPNVCKSCPNSSHASLNSTLFFFKIAHKVANYFWLLLLPRTFKYCPIWSHWANVTKLNISSIPNIVVGKMFVQRETFFLKKLFCAKSFYFPFRNKFWIHFNGKSKRHRLVVKSWKIRIRLTGKFAADGLWWWLVSGCSGRLRYQRSTVRIQSSANFSKEHLFTVNCIEKTNIKKKRPGMAHLKKLSYRSASRHFLTSYSDEWSKFESR